MYQTGLCVLRVPARFDIWLRNGFTSCMATQCWICNAPATTHEHTINAALVKIACGQPKPGAPWFFHNAQGANQRFQGLGSDLLKPYSDLCQKCNNDRTQPHDRAVEQFVKWLIAHKSVLQPGLSIDPKTVFPVDPAKGMLGLHLYFVKKFGCLIIEGRHNGTPIALDPSDAARAILRGKACPNLYLKFGRRPTSTPCVARSNPVAFLDDSGRAKGVEWRHYLGPFVVEALYFENVVPTDPAIRNAWHPRFGLRPIKVLAISNTPST